MKSWMNSAALAALLTPTIVQAQDTFTLEEIILDEELEREKQPPQEPASTGLPTTAQVEDILTRIPEVQNEIRTRMRESLNEYRQEAIAARNDYNSFPSPTDASWTLADAEAFQQRLLAWYRPAMLELARVEREAELLLASVERLNSAVPSAQVSTAMYHIGNMRAQVPGERFQLQALFTPYYELDAAIREARLVDDAADGETSDRPLLSTEAPCDLTQAELPDTQSSFAFTYEGQTIPVSTTAFLNFEAFTDPSTGRDLLQPFVSIIGTATLNLEAFRQLVRSSLPASDCNHRFKLESGGGLDVADNVQVSVPVRYEYWVCGSFDLPCVIDWTFTTCRQYVESRIFNDLRDLAWRAWFHVAEDEVTMRGYLGIPFGNDAAVVQERFAQRKTIDLIGVLPADIFTDNGPRLSAISLREKGETAFELRTSIKLNIVRPATGCFLKERLLELS